MGYIKEPDGIDFVINGKPLTDKQKQSISEFIRADKEKIALKARATTKKRVTNKVTEPA